MTRKPSVISLFSGAGGLDYGFEAAGFDVRVAHDFDSDCCATLRLNRSFAVIEGDIHDTSGDDLLEASGLERGRVSVLIGGPPCQPFSKAGYWSRGDTRRLSDPRARTLEAYMRCVRETLPEVFVLENVHGIRYSGKEEGLRFLEQTTEAINSKDGTKYALSWAVINAADFGVPQLRERFFLVGHREGGVFKFPRSTHRATGSTQGEIPLAPTYRRSPYLTAWEAIGDLRPSREEDLDLKGRWAGLLPSIPEGENYLWHTNRKGGTPLFGWRRHYWSFLLKLAKAKPSWTIQAQPGPAIGPFHWENRRLSAEEMARIQTFPRNLGYAGGRVSQQRQLGNAVPSLLAEVLAAEIGKQFFGRTRTELSLRIAFKKSIPPPEAVSPVPGRFLALEGDHADHPGTGMGPAASQRQIVDEEALTS